MQISKETQSDLTNGRNILFRLQTAFANNSELTDEDDMNALAVVQRWIDYCETMHDCVGPL